VAELTMTREEEIATLIAEQERDALYGDRITHSRCLSLDAPLTSDSGAGTWADLVGDSDVALDELLGEAETFIRTVRVSRSVTAKDVASWHWARTRRKWSYRKIGAHFGVSHSTVRRHLTKRQRRESAPLEYLEAKFEVIRAVYERGSRLIDIANEIYTEAGYASPESCYQGLRQLLIDRGVPRRPGRWKHGLRSQMASVEDQRRYRNEKNAELRRQGLTCTRKPIRPCPAVTKYGRPCRRLAVEDSQFCMVHGAAKHPTQKWTRANVCEALRLWESENGVAPATHDWERATSEHPSTGTVYMLFGSWPEALRVADLEPKPRFQPRTKDGRFIRTAA